MMAAMDPGTLSSAGNLLKEALSGLGRSRLARWRALRLAVRRCKESLREAWAVFDRPEDAWSRLAEDIELLRLAIYSFPKPKRDLVQLYERLKYHLRHRNQREVELRDLYLSAAVGALEQDLSAWWRSLWYVITGKTPAVMPTYIELLDEQSGEIRPGRWRRIADRWTEEMGTRSTLPKPWEL